MSGTLTDQGFPATGNNRTRADLQAAIADLVGGGNLPDIQARIDRAWDTAVRKYNAVPWKFTRVEDDIIIDSAMKSNVTPPTVASTGSGVGLVLETGRTIRYWLVERVKVGTRVTENNDADAPTTGPQLVTLTGTGAVVKPVITRPAVVNPNATHWALFATATSGTLSSTDAQYPHGYEVAEVDINTASIEDTRVGINPGFPANPTSIYFPGTYGLRFPFRNPVRALALDAQGQTRYKMQWVPWERWTMFRPWQITTGSNPIWYTAMNWHLTGKVIFDPRPGARTTYPMVRLTYNTPILPASDGPEATLNVPVEIDQAIFDEASVIVRRGVLGVGAVGADELAEMRDHYYALEVQWRDHEDF